MKPRMHLMSFLQMIRYHEEEVILKFITLVFTFTIKYFDLQIFKLN